MNNNEILEEAISTAMSILEMEEVGSESYSKVLNEVTKLYDRKIELDKIESGESKAALERGMETEKMLHEHGIEAERTKQTIIKSGSDILKAIALAVANGIWLRQIMKFEETGSISTKAFQLFGKVKLF